MQLNNFIQYIEYSEKIPTISEREIIPIIKEFPYCQTGQLMYAIQLYANNSILFESQLKKAASICPDRTKLFEHIHRERTIEIDKGADVDLVSMEMGTSDETKREIDDKEIFVSNEGKDELGLLEKEYISQAISSSILLESSNEVINSPGDSEVVEINLFDEDSTHSFSSWLKHYSGDETEVNPKNKKERNDDLINKFIQEDPRIKPKKTEFYSPANMAKQSVSDAGIVSETLALIHVDQGNFEEAISTYERLIVKNPKKNSYFVAQIKILKQKLK